MRGHLYCSERCARDSGLHAVWQRVHRLLSTTVPARAAVVLVALAASSPVILALKVVRELDRLSTPTPISRPRREPAIARLESVVDGAGGATLSGSASQGSAVFLFAGGRFVGAVPASGGRFRFEGLREKGPYRVGAMSLSAEGPAPAWPPASGSLRPEGSRAPALTPTLSVERPIALPAFPSAAPPRSLEPGGAVAPDLTHGPEDRRDILVSFDAGSSERGATEILDALRARGIRTTIFLTGEFIRRYPGIARRVAADGHEVGNHTDTHPHLTTYSADGRQITRAGLDRPFLAGELARTARLYREATGRAMAPVWRAPFGEQNAEIRRWAAEQGYWHVGWTGGRSGLDGLDWVTDPRSRSYQPAERLLDRLVRHAENGGIVLLHLGSDREEPVASRIGILLDGLKARGFRFALASEFLERAGLDAARLAAFRGASAAGLAR